MAAETEQRAAVVREARAWVGAGYHHNAAVRPTPTDRGAVDCARILIETFAGAELIAGFVPEPYAADWHLHRGEERYLAVVERYCRLVDEDFRPLSERGQDFTAQPGDVLMWRWGRTYSHSAIVTEWPRIIHAFAHEQCVVECDVRGTPMSEQPMRVYSFWSGE